MFESQPPTLLDRFFSTIAEFFNWEVVGRAVFMLCGVGFIFFAVRSMLRGQFTVHEVGYEEDWEFVPAYIFIGAFFLYIGLRKKTLAQWNRESYDVPPTDQSDEEPGSEPKN